MVAESPEDALIGLKGDERIIQEAHDRFARCVEWESYARKEFELDLKFANGDPDNGYQWPDELRAQRESPTQQRPCLTINKTRQHNLQIINDAKQNKPGVMIRPVGNEATYEAAQIFEGVIRHIEYISNATVAYDTATTFQVESGIGYWRIVTDYADDDSFDQEIFIRRVKDPKSVFLDPDIREVDGSDARFGFIFEDVPRDEFDRANPRYKTEGGNENAIGNLEDGWSTDTHVRVAEYYRRTPADDRLIAFNQPDGSQVIQRLSRMTPQEKLMLAAIKEAGGAVQERKIASDTVEWFKVAGDKIIDRRVIECRYIPIVRVIGEETVINGVMDRKGHTRAMKDAQRMYNYHASAAVEFVALQTKAPYIAAAEAIEGRESVWNNANTQNPSVLTYNGFDDEGAAIPRPERSQPPVLPAAYIQAMQVAQNEMMMVSGQYQAQMGENENAKSGKAIAERQRQGDNATYHFIDNLGIAIRFTGKILLDMIPRVYDTRRVIRITGDDGVPKQVLLDPQAQQAYLEEQKSTAEEVRAIFNPNVGRYEVEADTGPGYATRRQEAWNAFVQIASQNQEFMQIAGDLLFKVADFPMAEELAERWRRTIDPRVLGDGLPPPIDQQIKMLQANNQQLQTVIGKLTETLGENSIQLKDHGQENAVRGYDAETKRIVAIGNSGPAITPEQIAPALAQLLGQMAQDGPPLGAQPGISPRQAPDGNWYVPDQSRPGKYMMVQ